MNLNNCFLLVNNQAYSKYFDATGKAPEDIERILLDAGVEKVENVCCDINETGKSRNKAIVYVNEVKNGFHQARNVVKKLPDGSVLIYQYPSVFFGDYPELYFFLLFIILFSLILRKSIRVMFIIHDLPSIRFQDKHLMKWERRIFHYASYIVSHNERMTDYIHHSLFFNGRIEDLHIFDYLVDKPKIAAPHLLHTPATIAYAGNLVKPGFIYKLNNVGGNQFHLFGKLHESDKERLYGNCEYKGCYSPEELPIIMDEDFGLIWDGDSIDGVTGLMGEYMRYNDPHKLSLYMVAHIPVIVWKESSIATFVENNNVGFAVNSLAEIDKRIQEITPAEYEKMYASTVLIAKELTAGNRIKECIDQVLN